MNTPMSDTQEKREAEYKQGWIAKHNDASIEVIIGQYIKMEQPHEKGKDNGKRD